MSDFAENAEVRRGIAAVVDHLKTMKRGEYVNHAELAVVAGMDDSPAFRSNIVHRARVAYTDETGIATSGVGETDQIRILTLAENISWAPAHRRLKARRQMVKSLREQRALRANCGHELTVEQLNTVNANIEVAGVLRRQIARDERARETMAANEKQRVTSPAVAGPPRKKYGLGQFAAFMSR